MNPVSGLRCGVFVRSDGWMPAEKLAARQKDQLIQAAKRMRAKAWL
jgi:hypothetical protein